MKNRNLKPVEALFLFVTVILLPCFFLQTGLRYFERQKKNRQIEETSLKLLEPVKEISLYKDNESFWCKTLLDIVNKAKKPDTLVEKIEHLSKLTNEPLEYIIWDRKNQVIRSNFLKPEQFQLWNDVCKDLYDARMSSGASERNKYESRVRKAIGPHYFADGFSRPTSARDPAFIRTSSNLRSKLIWFDHSSKYRTMIFFNHDVIHRDSRLSLFMERHAEIKQNLFIVNPAKRIDLNDRKAVFLKRAAINFLNKGEGIFHQDNSIAAITSFNPDTVIINTQDLESNTRSPEKEAALIYTLALFLLLLMIRNNVISINPEHVSVAGQLLLILFVCSGLPIMVLALGGLKHLEQKKTNLIRAAHQRCVEFIQDIDKRSQTEFSLIMNKGESSLKVFRDLYKSGASEFDLFDKTFQAMHPSRTDFRAVASSGNFLLTQIGFQKNGKFNDFKNAKEHGRVQRATTELKVLNDLGAYFLSFLNRAPMDPMRFTEIELLTEMFYQKPLSEVMHDLILLESVIEKLGWGSHEFPVFAKTIGIDPERPEKDFFFMIPYSLPNIVKTYFKRHLDNIMRNPYEIRVFMSDNAFIFPGQRHLHTDKTLNLIFSQTGVNPSSEPQIVEYENEKWIYSSFQGQFASQFKLLALSPMRKIDAELAQEKEFLVQTSFAAIFILISLTMIFGHSFIFPLNQLFKGAIAVETHQAGIQIPDLGEDEFGEIGRLFNRSIGELEELAVASIVQSRLMPEHTIDAGIFDIYGKTVPMADLGGDYFDYFSVDDDHFAVMLGDVAGHGVGASLIMAMAKAGIICCQQNHSQPVAVIRDLHRMICTTRSKTQKKVMTFQYLYLDKKSGKGKYANAGGCSPMLVNFSEASVTELTLAAPVLGGFKNARFSEIDLQLQKNEALVFYTDGIIESKNPAGNELGYENFKTMLLQSWNNNASDFYKNIFRAYLKWIDSAPPQDDMTLIVVVNKEKAA